MNCDFALRSLKVDADALNIFVAFEDIKVAPAENTSSYESEVVLDQ